MKSQAFTILALFVVAGCATQKSGTTSRAVSGDTRTIPVAYIDNNTYLLLESSDDNSYAYAQSNPVKVGSGGGSGPLNERRFLNALRGPQGEAVTYFRAGSCCPFKTPNGLMDMGMLDQYRVSWEGASDTLDIYINMYDEGDLKIPVGFTAAKK